MRTLLFLIIAGVAGIFGALWVLQFESFPPRAEIAEEVSSLGRSAKLDITVHADAPGLHLVEVRVRPESGSADDAVVIHEQTFAANSWRGSGVRQARVEIEADFAELKVPEGPATLEVFVESYAWHVIPSASAPRLTLPIEVDLSPPRIEVLSTSHSLRLGGVDVLVFRQSADTVESGVAVEDYFFPAKTGYFADPTAALAFFAVPQDLDTSARVRLIARDAAGNEREVRIPCIVRARSFRERTLPITDDFLTRKVPELQADNDLPATTDLLQGYVDINRNLRQRNEEQIRAVTRESSTRIAWDGGFLRQARAASVSNFGDRRAYEYNGEIVDRQVHLGFDLASVKQAPIESTQAGTVVFAGNLGIYGETVIIDHGLGIFSLYGHMSSIAVAVGEAVARGAKLGRTGITGLAGGDHLHFSIMLHGIHVDPVEWWDDRWLKNQILAKLALLPQAAPATGETN